MTDVVVPDVRKGALMLTIAGFAEYGLQFLLPVIFVRTLTVAEYGEYRLIGLAASTALAIAPLYMPQGLLFFLPKTVRAERGVAVGNVIAFMAVAGVLVGCCYLVFRGAAYEGSLAFAVPLFLGLWTFAHLLDWLPTADGNAVWQGRMILGLAVLRIGLLSCAAILARDLTAVVYALAVCAAAKTALVFVYARRAFGFAALRPRTPLFLSQIKYALPFAGGNALFLLRGQADQWIVTALFSTKTLAVLSVAASVLAVATLLRQPINTATLPRISAAMQRGAPDVARDLATKANTASTLLLFPILGFLFVCADEVVKIVYTETYQEAAPFMRLYVAGLVLDAFAVGHLLVAVDRGRSALRISILSFLIAVTVSLLGALTLGPIGAPLGRMAGAALGTVLGMRVVASAMQTSPLSLIRWDVTRKVGMMTVAAVVASEAVKAALNLSAGTAATALTVEATIYSISFAIGLWGSGLWQEISSMANLNLKWVFRR